MSTQRGVEGDVAWFLEGADEVARAKNRLQAGLPGLPAGSRRANRLRRKMQFRQ
jgi:hypothetical protein